MSPQATQTLTSPLVADLSAPPIVRLLTRMSRSLCRHGNTGNRHLRMVDGILETRNIKVDEKWHGLVKRRARGEKNGNCTSTRKVREMKRGMRPAWIKMKDVAGRTKRRRDIQNPSGVPR